jgi:hypothetical protein
MLMIVVRKSSIPNEKKRTQLDDYQPGHSAGSLSYCDLFDNDHLRRSGATHGAGPLGRGSAIGDV